jgi:hypothetical protein
MYRKHRFSVMTHRLRVLRPYRLCGRNLLQAMQKRAPERALAGNRFYECGRTMRATQGHL